MTKDVPVEFTGKSGEYFKLWFVNIFLSIVTLGIYSAWAKVRNTQYIYGHTSVDGHNFRFLATPVQILKGRVIAVLVFILYVFLGRLNPVLSVILDVALLIALPWLIVQGIRFSLRMTAYRNVRFSFNGTYGGALLNFIVLPVLALFTLFLMTPWVMRRVDQYMLGNVSYGGKPFTLNTLTGKYYLAATAASGAAFLGFAAMILGIATFLTLGAANDNFDIAAMAFGNAPVFLMLGSFVLMYVVIAVYQSIIRNHVMHSLQLPDVVSFRSDVKMLPYTWLMLSNALLILFTLGFAFPVTKIRKNVFLAQATRAMVEPGLESLVNTVSADSENSAFGEEAAGMFDTDLSLN